MTEPSSPPDDEPSPPPRRTAAVWLATGLGVGLVTPAPGTFGTLWGLPLAWGYAQLPGPVWPVVAAVAMILLGVPICTRAAHDLATKDPGPVVWDEFATLPLVFWFVPLGSWQVALLGFTLHRLCDISKPWPCRRLERLPAGWGIMADDVAAALYAAAALWLLAWGFGL